MMIAMIDMGKLYREGLRMTGIEGILQRLRDEWDEKNAAYGKIGFEVDTLVDTLKDKEKVYRDMGSEVDALSFAIEAIHARLNGQSVPVNLVEESHKPKSLPRTNPFPPKTIAWFCFDILKDDGIEMHCDDIWKAVKKYRHCSSKTVSHELYVQKEVFKLVGNGIFALVDA
jgi:hypothetical protein